MADAKITDLTANTTPLSTDLLAIVDDPSGSATTQKITAGNFMKVINDLAEDTAPSRSNDFVATYDSSGTTVKKVRLGSLGSVSNEGAVENGEIYVSVTTNDLYVNLKNTDGSNPSTSDVVYVTIAGEQRTVNAALECILNDGTNWFNSGAAEFAAKSVNYFVYLCWVTASSAVAIGYSRLPSARTYADFSGTTTNEKYIKFATGSNSSVTPASTDAVVNIGRFTATLSAGAGYTWSISGTGDVVNYPLYETNWLTWSPQFTNLSVGNGTLTGYYKINYDSAVYKWALTWGNSTSISGSVTHTLPFTRTGYTDVRQVGFARFNDATGSIYQGSTSFTSATAAVLQVLNASGTYLTTGALSSTVPFTWTTSDEIMVEIYPYQIK